MSPRTMADNEIRSVGQPPVVAFDSRQQGASHQQRARDEQQQRQQQQAVVRPKKKKPLSSGFKDIIWTSPPPVGVNSTATSSQGWRSSPQNSQLRSLATASASSTTSSGFHHLEEDNNDKQQQAARTLAAGNSTTGNGKGRRTGRERPTSAEEARKQQQQQQGGGDGNNNEALNPARFSSAPLETTGNGAVIVERSLSDTSVVTASDLGAPVSNKPTILTDLNDHDAVRELMGLLGRGKGLPVVKHATGLGGKSRKLLRLNELGGELALCGMLPPYFKTKIPVRDVDRVDAKWCCAVIHAKGRSALRLEVDSFATADTLRVGLMAASRMQPISPPSNRPPTAATGLATLAATQGIDSQPPTLDSPDGVSQPDPEQGLASVRPGHRQSEIYDPDAALSVAALLAKEMEEERMLALGGGDADGAGRRGWASARDSSRPEATPPAEAPPKPLLKRSASMNSVVSSASRMGESSCDSGPGVNPATSRQSLPRGYGGPMLAPGAGGGEELVVVDPKASLRRLYAAIEGRGMVAIKRNPSGKGRSRVMVRSKIKENSIGWAHVLPPFTRKFVNVKDLAGAQRSSRVVTVNFRNREPVFAIVCISFLLPAFANAIQVMFETDKLTDALILEQGFVSLATLQKHNL
ncbi:unnamed protein product [Ectocarpus sp. 4 AP-2014]